MNTFTYAIGDIHGRLDIVIEAIARIEKHQSSHKLPSKIVFLGDYIDRGPESKEVCDLLRAGSSHPDIQWIFIQGNHEVMCLEAHYGGPSDLKFWKKYGGYETLLSFGSDIVPRSYLTWMAGMKKYYYDGKRVFVHAGIKENVPLEHNPESALQWIRFQGGQEIVCPEGYVVHGHTPSIQGPEVLNSRCCIDTLAHRSGRLAIAVFDDSIPGGPVEMLSTYAGYQLDSPAD